MIKTRFAPSPTGFLHVGGLRTALYAYLFAKKQGGVFALRIEDTDKERFVEGGIENIVRSLAWAGLRPDEGVDLDKMGKITQKGDCGPYIQSTRLDIYKKHVDELIKKGHGYYCFCSKERLDELRKMQELNKMPTGYDRHCCNLSKEEIEKRLKANEPHVVRMKIPKEGITKLNDLIKGEVEFKNELIDDQVILKADGYPTYHLAVVVDDHLMKITHVIRGEEWLSSTPKHIQLYKMFGWKAPEFAHLPLLLNPDKSKLSKRQGDVAVENYKAKGYLPEAMINFVAFLGWNPGTDKELFTLDELVKEFNLSRVNKSGAVFNLQKLDWYNEQYIRQMNLSELVERCVPFLIEARLIKDYRKITDEYKKWLEGVVALERGRVANLSQISEALKFVFIDKLNYDAGILVWKKSTKKETEKNLKLLSEILLSTKIVQIWTKENLEAKIGEWIKEEELSAGSVLWPMRVALSGQENSPGPFEIAEVLGREKTVERLTEAFKKL
ncbi:glutamate--tRNA ligase [Candidatus Peregrinibacteria bacterium]|nr:glutamate--tRNA ligase [Candidatus Peregrinibacteria bacterium]MBI5254338.1 glutamate--tRNA ligase [Candidatus Falkowbacteria bacterium]